MVLARDGGREEDGEHREAHREFVRDQLGGAADRAEALFGVVPATTGRIAIEGIEVRVDNSLQWVVEKSGFRVNAMVGLREGAIGTGPSATRSDLGDQSYSNLVQPWMNRYTHDLGMLVHVYTLDDDVDFKSVMDAGVDGIFTNRASELLKFYKRPAAASVDQVLKNNGF